MKNYKKILFVMFFLCVSVLFAADSAKSEIKTSFNEKVIKSLITGIESGNTGLRKSCIQFAGIYKIKALRKNLLAEYEKTSDFNEKIIISLALSFIDSPENSNPQLQALLTDSTLCYRDLSSVLQQEKKQTIKITAFVK